MASNQKEKPQGFSFCQNSLPSSLVKRGVVAIDVLVIGTFLHFSQALAKALIVDDLALAQKLNGIAHVRIVAKAQNVVVGHARLLLCCYHVFATFCGLQKIEFPLIL